MQISALLVPESPAQQPCINPMHNKPPPTDEMLLALAEYLSEKYKIINITSVLEPDSCDEWSGWRDDECAVVPLPRYELEVNLNGFDTRIFRPIDVRFFKTLAAQHKFIYCPETAPHRYMRFQEIPPVPEIIASELVCFWGAEKPPRRLASYYAKKTPDDRITGAKIFLRLIRSVVSGLESPSYKKALILVTTILRDIDSDVLNRDEELARLRY